MKGEEWEKLGNLIGGNRIEGLGKEGGLELWGDDIGIEKKKIEIENNEGRWRNKSKIIVEEFW